MSPCSLIYQPKPHEQIFLPGVIENTDWKQYLRNACKMGEIIQAWMEGCVWSAGTAFFWNW
jgi:hypothetical protein